MNDNDQAVMLSLNKRNDLPGRLWADDDFTAVEDGTADFNAGLTSLGFIRAALRRSARFWGAMAVAGLLIGAAVYVASPPADQASTTLLLTVGPEAVPGTAIQDDQAIAQSRAVAGLVVHKLGLPQSVSSFLGSYTATPVTDRVLLITVNAPSSNEAVSRANAVAAEFLQYRAKQLKAAAAADVHRARPAGQSGQAAGQHDQQPDQQAVGSAPITRAAGHAHQAADAAQPGEQRADRAAARRQQYARRAPRRPPRRR